MNDAAISRDVSVEAHGGLEAERWRNTWPRCAAVIAAENLWKTGPASVD